MIYLSLPLFYSNVNFNNNFQYLIKRRPEILKEEIVCLYNHGSFPYTIWNGGKNNNFNSLLLYDNLMQTVNIFANSICLDCSNILLDEKDFYNNYMNQVINLFDYSSNFIEVSNLTFFNFLKNKFPNYKYVFSEKANEINEFNSEIINTIQETNNFNYIVLPQSLKEEELKKIKNKNNIFILIGNKCSNCSEYKECLIKENELQLNFSKHSIFSECNKNKKYLSAQDLLFEINYYKQLGFNHFKIDTPPNNIKINEFNALLIETFVKPEYQFEILKGMV